MSDTLTRRRLLQGTALATLATLDLWPAAASAARPGLSTRDLVALRDLVHRDYVEGRLVVVDGWIMSEHEARGTAKV